MKTLTLTRFAYAPCGTFGELKIEGTPFRCFTVERPWVDLDQDHYSDVNQSCIPEGIYPIKPSIHHPNTAAAYPCYVLEHTANRAAIQIHIANTMYDLLGCIGVGNLLGSTRAAQAVFPVWSVLNSGTTFKQFMEAMGGDEGVLTIGFTTQRPTVCV